MRNTLLDAGPLIALFDKNDSYHHQAIDFVKDYRGKLLTTWPVITEASHMLSFNVNVQLNLIKWIDRGGLHLFDLSFDHLERLIHLSEKFKDVPMDLADATLIVAAETTGVNEIATIDGDFYVYRDIRNQYLNNIFI
ncbi:MAG: pilus assembly protein [Bacteroidota bacterium]